MASRDDRTHAAWTTGHITGLLLIDIKTSFPSMAKRRLVNILMVKRMDGDIERWTESFLSEQTAKLIFEGNSVEIHSVYLGVP